jgi:signal transduction histidine kinase
MPAVLAIIRRNAEMQARLIDDLLDMNRLLSGNVTLELGTVDMGAILHRTIQALQPAADAKRVRLIAVLDAPAACRGDARRLQQVLWNLAHNAIKFTPAGGYVELRLTRADDAVQVSVSDTGRGIAPAFLPYVFDRFRQQDSSASRESSGLGIGLSIARHLAELHGGTIQARSAGVDQGATFTVTLPEYVSEAAGHTPAVGAAPR